MDFDALEKIWGRQKLTGPEVASDAVVAELKREVSHARRRIRGGIVLVIGVMLLGWLLLLAAYFLGIKRVTPIDVLAEVIGFLLDVAFVLRAAYSIRVTREAEAAIGGTLRESLLASLRAVNVQIANARIAAVAIPSVVAICAALFTAKHLLGNLRLAGVVSGTGFVALLGLAIGGAMWHRYRTYLRPREAELRGRLRAIEEEVAE